MYQTERCYKNNITTEEDLFSQHAFFPELTYHTLHSKKFVLYRYKMKYGCRLSFSADDITLSVELFS